MLFDDRRSTLATYDLVLCLNDVVVVSFLLLYFCAVTVNISSDLNTSLAVLFCFGTIHICPAVLHKTHNNNSKVLYFFIF